jgi:hypothetical protein
MAKRHQLGLRALQSPQKPHSSLVYGLVPDGVASVTLKLPAHLAPGYHERYPHAYADTGTVVANAFIFPDCPPRSSRGHAEPNARLARRPRTCSAGRASGVISTHGRASQR